MPLNSPARPAWPEPRTPPQPFNPTRPRPRACDWLLWASILRRTWSASYIQNDGGATGMRQWRRRPGNDLSAMASSICLVVLVTAPKRLVKNVMGGLAVTNIAMSSTKSGDKKRTKGLKKGQKAGIWGREQGTDSRPASAPCLGPIRRRCLCRKGWDLLSRELLPVLVGLQNLTVFAANRQLSPRRKRRSLH